MGGKFYPFRLSWGVLILSVVMLVLICGPTLGFPAFIFAYHFTYPAAPFSPLESIAFGIPALLFGIFVVIAAYSPKGAVISPDGISVVKRWTRPVVVPESQILSLERIDRSVLRRTIRLMGAGGFLGSWGYFSCKKLGTFRAYLTNSQSLVLIRTVSEGLFVISPENPADFIASAESFGLCPSRESQ